MNLQRLFKIQAELDNAIIEKKGLHGQDLLAHRILALLVELGECANEWRGFKFWSEDQEPRTFASRMKYSDPINMHGAYPVSYSPLLEEYVDCLYFVLSIGNELSKSGGLLLEHDDPEIFEPANEVRIVEKFNSLYSVIGELNFEYMKGDAYLDSLYYELINEFISLGKGLGLEKNEIESAYLDKNKINHERQVTGY
ncbi:dUTP diphosphatase [Alkalihalobacillus sp. LMS6]|uniref:dUTP diphosphatase n=1 Tax=Alkalihalobacillus sp. LMS6 TaxID=2924034 RepID=UPI0020D0216C|nr:dUTP diphosphatase [Alkalihalobacillus sp. LMS6]UTR05405.1 dUTP diphosphatase [Alkalihalobacillus sp. LMS6]